MWTKLFSGHSSWWLEPCVCRNFSLCAHDHATHIHTHMCTQHRQIHPQLNCSRFHECQQHEGCLPLPLPHIWLPLSLSLYHSFSLHCTLTLSFSCSLSMQFFVFLLLAVLGNPLLSCFGCFSFFSCFESLFSSLDERSLLQIWLFYFLSSHLSLSLSPSLLVPNTEPLTLPLSGSGISYASPRCWGVQGLISPLFLSRSGSGSSTSTSSASPLVLSLPNGGIMFYFQLVIMAGTVLLAYYFEYTDTFPVHIQGFFCYDKTFSKPYPGPDDTSKIPPVLIYSLVTAIPTLTVRVLIIYSFPSMEVKLGRYGRGWVV